MEKHIMWWGKNKQFLHTDVYMNTKDPEER